MFNGIIVSLFQDEGPQVIYNSTKFNRDEVLKFAIRGITILQDIVGNYLYGPFPTSLPEVNALTYNFYLPTMHSIDRRIKIFGRPAQIWLLYENTYEEIILSNYDILEFYFKSIIRKLRIMMDEDFSMDRCNQLNQITENFLKQLSLGLRELFVLPAESDEFIPLKRFSTLDKIRILAHLDFIQKRLTFLLSGSKVQIKNFDEVIMKLKGQIIKKYGKLLFRENNGDFETVIIDIDRTISSYSTFSDIPILYSLLKWLE